MSETLVDRPTPVDLHPREIIDVDSWDSEDTEWPGQQRNNVRSPRPTNRRRLEGNDVDPIMVDDSDDEVQHIAGPSRSSEAGPVPGSGFRRRHIAPPSYPRHYLFSPPPMPQDNLIPPVPRLPREHLPFIVRRDTPPGASHVFRAMERPLPFEHNLRPISRHPVPAPDNPRYQSPRPPSEGPRRNFNMGLGGAILALGHQNQNEYENAHPRTGVARRANLIQYIPAFLRRRWGIDNQSLDDEDADLLNALAASVEDRQGNPGHGDNLRMGTGPGHRFLHHVTPDYKKTYTHSQKPQPGFTFDFTTPPDPIVLDDNVGSSSASGSGSSSVQDARTTIVCAKCLDPLAINVTGSEEEIRRRRIWGLRCGHLLDGKCIDAIMKPVVQVVLDDKVLMTLEDKKGKGKAVNLRSTSPPISFSTQASAQILEADRVVVEGHDIGHRSPKGKGKAREIEGLEPLPSTSSTSATKGKRKAVEPSLPMVSSTDSDTHYRQEPVSSPNNGMRARLRSRNSTDTLHGQSSSNNTASLSFTSPPAHSQSSPVPMSNDLIFSTPLSPSSPTHSHFPSTHPNTRAWSSRVNNDSRPNSRSSAPSTRGRGRGRGKGRGKGKGKGKADPAPVIEAQHEWLCPVAGCGRPHCSVLIGGVWRMDERDGRGAIPIFV